MEWKGRGTEGGYREVRREGGSCQSLIQLPWRHDEFAVLRSNTTSGSVRGDGLTDRDTHTHTVRHRDAHTHVHMKDCSLQ